MTDEVPFARYKDGGREPLGPPGRHPAARGGTGCRDGYGLGPVAEYGPNCAYCDRDLALSYDGWLNLSLDHVVPMQAALLGYPREWLDDVANCVPACRTCNEFLNRDTVDEPPTTWGAFLDLRDRRFLQKRALLRVRHQRERQVWQALREAGRLPAAPTDGL